VKLASLKAGGRDGTLIVVNRDLSRFVPATDIAGTLQQALDNWSMAAPRLNALYDALNGGVPADAGALDFNWPPAAFESLTARPLPHVGEFAAPGAEAFPLRTSADARPLRLAFWVREIGPGRARTWH
jgi:fumarylacetoacetate (FAA) hydrolase